MRVDATNSLGWEVQTRRIHSKDEWRPAVTEVIGYTDDDESIEVPIDPFETRGEAEEFLKEIMYPLRMDPEYEFRVYEVVGEKEKK